MNLRVDTGGSLVNIDRLLRDRRAQFAIVQYDALLYKKAYNDSKLDKKLAIIFPLYNEEIHLIVNRNAGINALSDLNGKKVNTDKKNSGCWVTATIIKEAAKLTWEEHHLPPVDGIKAVIDGKLDAFIFVCGKPAPFLQILGKEASEFIKLVPLEMDALYPSTVIKAGTYPWLNENVKTNITKALLITWNYWKNPNKKRFGDYVDAIREMITTVYKKLDHLKTEGHPKWKEVDPYEYKSLKWPLHHAALQVLEKGRLDTEKEKKMEKLFELLQQYQ
jgi:TRAP transporter TAXI family solute receptor